MQAVSSMMHRTILLYDILRRLRGGKEGIGDDSVHTSKNCMHDGDLVFHTKAEKGDYMLSDLLTLKVLYSVSQVRNPLDIVFVRFCY